MGTFDIAPIARALIGAAVILCASAALAFASGTHLDPELATRLWGVLLGMTVVVYANAAPRTLTPLARLRCDPVTEQAVRRFSAWMLVLGGVGYAAAWLFAPIGIAGPLAIGLLGGALLAVMVRWGWTKASTGTGV